jgi:hypothetical protein
VTTIFGTVSVLRGRPEGLGEMPTLSSTREYASAAWVMARSHLETWRVPPRGPCAVDPWERHQANFQLDAAPGSGVKVVRHGEPVDWHLTGCLLHGKVHAATGVK